MEIRPARPDEFDEVGQITVEAYRAIVDDALLDDYEDELRDVAARAADCAVLIAVDDRDTVVGAVTYVPGADTALSEFSDSDAAGIRMLAVRPERQGEGVGRALTEACISTARAASRSSIVLHSTPTMAVARGMYERMGFVARPDLDEWVSAPPFSAEEPLHLIAYVMTL